MPFAVKGPTKSVQSEGEKLLCKYCTKPVHDVNNCYELFGYPEHWNTRITGRGKGCRRRSSTPGRGQGGGARGGNMGRNGTPVLTAAHVAATHGSDASMTSSMTKCAGTSSGIPGFTPEQIQRILSLIEPSHPGAESLSEVADVGGGRIRPVLDEPDDARRELGVAHGKCLEEASTETRLVLVWPNPAPTRSRGGDGRLAAEDVRKERGGAKERVSGRGGAGERVSGREIKSFDDPKRAKTIDIPISGKFQAAIPAWHGTKGLDAAAAGSYGMSQYTTQWLGTRTWPLEGNGIGVW
ncbi:hypothetical protein Drorol1_Dr00005075 [Drosera rotundifolia]